jgi:hypothetical protein
MPKPIKRVEPIRRLRSLRWDGPFQKGKNPFMVKNGMRLAIPNPHGGDIDWSLTKRILQQAGISSDQWDAA